MPVRKVPLFPACVSLDTRIALEYNNNKRGDVIDFSGTNPNHILGSAFCGNPGYISFSEGSPYFERFADATPDQMNGVVADIQREMGVAWSVSGDRENRVGLYRHNEGIMREGRTVHVGLDINVPLGSALYSPYDALVAHTDYEVGEGNYGWMSILETNVGGQTLYLLFGHLAQTGRAAAGALLQAGGLIGYVGDFHENGNYFHHTHLQMLTPEALDHWTFRALCRAGQVEIGRAHV
jgi:hypothetical protein